VTKKIETLNFVCQFAIFVLRIWKNFVVFYDLVEKHLFYNFLKNPLVRREKS